MKFSLGEWVKWKEGIYGLIINNNYSHNMVLVHVPGSGNWALNKKEVYKIK